jgi:hypothetical protein
MLAQPRYFIAAMALAIALALVGLIDALLAIAHAAKMTCVMNPVSMRSPFPGPAASLAQHLWPNG